MEPEGHVGEARLLRTLQGAPDVRLTACSRLVPAKQQIATGSQDGTVLLWTLTPNRPRPIRLGAHKGAVTSLAASSSGKSLVSSSQDSSVCVWRSPWEKPSKKPSTLKLHFLPVRSIDLSFDERFLLTASDDKTIKLSSLTERKFVASYLGHSNWVRAASFSSTASHIVSGGDDKTVRLWDVERKSCLQSFHDSASSITCSCFGLDDNIIVASSWDSSINIWDVRAFGLRQHYGRAHGGSPITQVAVHPFRDLLLSAAADRQLRLWDLRMGRLQDTILGHDRPIHSCAWDDQGEHFASCDSELVFYWSLPLPPKAAETAEVSPEVAEMPPEVAEVEEDGRPDPDLHAEQPAPRPGPEPCPEAGSAAGEVRSGSLEQMLEAAWAGEKAIQTKVSDLKDQPDLPEAAALMLEKMVADMDVLTNLLQSIEARMAHTEATTAELAQLLKHRAAESSVDTSAPK